MKRRRSGVRRVSVEEMRASVLTFCWQVIVADGSTVASVGALDDDRRVRLDPRTALGAESDRSLRLDTSLGCPGVERSESET